MARLIERLDDTAIRGLTEPAMYPDGDGLYLRVSPSGSRSWILRYRLGNRRRDMGLGRWPLFGVKDARKRANAHRRLLADGIDPLEQSKPVAAPSGHPFAEVVDLLVAAKRQAWGRDQERAWHQTMRDHVLPSIGQKPVAEITVHDVKAVLKPIWTTKPVAASVSGSGSKRCLTMPRRSNGARGTTPPGIKAILNTC